MHRKHLRLLPVLVLVCAGVLALLASRQASAQGKKAAQLAPGDAGLVHQIHRYRNVTWHWQSIMGVRRTPSTRGVEQDPSHAFKRWVRDLWKHRAVRARLLAAHPPHRAAWLCIHHFEGAWTSATGNGYYGGLQMDLGFMRRYGRELLRRKGTADRWTPLEQIWVAEHAYRSGRGFYPWPNTARACGLI